VYLSGEPDPEPAMASKKQDEKRRQAHFVFEYHSRFTNSRSLSSPQVLSLETF